MILTLLDTGLRITELCTLTMDKLFLEDGIARVTSKGNKERMIPIGKQVQRALWHYIMGGARHLMLNARQKEIAQTSPQSIAILVAMHRSNVSLLEEKFVSDPSSLAPSLRIQNYRSSYPVYGYTKRVLYGVSHELTNINFAFILSIMLYQNKSFPSGKM